MVRLVPLLLLTLGCRRPPEAPRELDALTHYLYREFNTSDPEVLRAGMVNLQDFLKKRDLSGEVKVLDRAWELTSVRREDLDDIEWPEDRSPSDTFGVAVARLSRFPISEHGDWQLLANQLPAEPSAVKYRRFFPEGDPACFSDHGCKRMVTENEIERKNLFLTVQFTLPKDFRWVALEEDEWGMISRGWFPRSVTGENGSTHVWQSYSMDVWIPDGDKTQRYQVLWSEADVGGASDKIQIGVVKNSTDDHFEATDEAIANR